MTNSQPNRPLSAFGDMLARLDPKHGDAVEVLCVTPASALDADPDAHLERYVGGVVDLRTVPFYAQMVRRDGHVFVPVSVGGEPPVPYRIENVRRPLAMMTEDTAAHV